ncbi:ADK2 [Candida pseudojiufengensis]|uniref:ADK2 n=1 Tax=Candida pseudojiufengensis TaxID=497109 RepID=UPI002224496C|nr:ADK2 [Candida pseudojiufengensis]KAI5960854.1 ADK2 [Candida pseudojiufengensis]
MNLIKPTRLLLLGAPGSGKGTISKRLLDNFKQLKSIASGDVLRSQISQKTSIGLKAESYLKSGSLVPDSIMINLITNQLQNQNLLHSNSNWLLDGFPRTFNQAKELNHVLDENQSNLNLVIELNVDQNIILKRIESRYVHLPSGRIYNLDYNPPKVPFKDDITGEPLTKREDDTAEVFSKRLIKYNEEIQPMRQYFQKLGIWHEVSGNTSDIIYPKVEKLVISDI